MGSIGPYWLYLFWNNYFDVVDRVMRMYEYDLDATIPINRKLAYSELIEMICRFAGWNKDNVRLDLTLVVFDSHGAKRRIRIMND